MRFGWVSVTGVVCLALWGCGPGSGPVRTELMAPEPLAAADYRAPGLPAQFGDTKPHPWEGRPPASYPVHGIDAARYQGKIDWPKARAAGVEFAWLKATEGGDHIDPGYGANAARARAAGVAVGAYHFYYFCRPAIEQADWFIRTVPARKGDLPPVLDIEWNHTSPSCQLRPPAAKVRAEMRIFLNALEAHYGTQPVVYTDPKFYEDNDLGRMAGVEFWLRSVSAHPSEKYPNERWSFWQYSGTGVVPGIGGTVDLNAFGGSRTGWENWLSGRAQ
ncbi:glycoside hydrolase [Rhodobacter sp. TJ_12]|uniref:GH25 family lysozyme n=1 Tax=Rhodobacter sp. TJ_12 TaxID=2029399 RepID=UPI001CBC2CEC|nr:GH25 family lysozyme [Rhodobacter sp. TJ_12]MBZ4022763.1 glycoside hydrolase [Rhodobacter sp. TJ_12]